MIGLIQDMLLLVKLAVDWILIVAVVGVVVLVLLRWIFLSVQPIGWLSFYIRRLTDPMIWPIAQMMPANANAAPLFLVLGTLISAYFLKSLTDDVARSLLGVLSGISDGALLQIVGWVLYGVVAILLVLIVARIVFSWIPFMRDGKLMWTLNNLTEPIMAPFRRLIPPLGMFDLSPIILIFLLNFAQSALVRVLGLRIF